MTARRICVLAVAALAVVAQAETSDPKEIEELVVVATKREVAARDVAADVVVITREDLSAYMSRTLADAFRYVPGINIEHSGTRFGDAGLSIRGIGGNRIAIELDGVPVSDQFDVGRFSNASRLIVESGLAGQVEVLRGPASALYGSSALGGVVSVRTLEARDVINEGATGGLLNAVHRSADHSADIQAVAAQRFSAFDALVSLGWREGSERDAAAGNPDEQDFEVRSGLLTLTGSDGAGNPWRLSALRQEDDIQTNVRSVLGSGRFRSTTRLTGDDSRRADILSGEYRFAPANRFIDDGRIRLFYSNVDIEQDTLDERAAARTPVSIERHFFYEQKRRGVEVNLWRDFDTGAWSHRFGIGASWRDARTEELRDGLSISLVDGSSTNVVLGETFPLRDFPLSDTRELGAYVSDEIRRGPLTLHLGLRFDRNRLSPTGDPVYAGDNPDSALVSLEDSDLSPKLGAVWRVRDDVDLYAQYARGFRAPPFEDANIGLDIPLFNVRAIPNPDLRSEQSDGYEIGVRGRGRWLDWSAALFHTSYDDFIETKARVGIDPVSGRLLFQSINIESARIRGAELRAEWRADELLDGLALSAAAYWSEGENRDSGESLNSVGPPQAVLGVSWVSQDRATRLDGRLVATAGWTRRDDSAGELFEPPGHGVIDLFASRRIGERLDLTLAIENLTDRRYWRAFAVSGLGPDDAALDALSAPGRSFSIGARYGF